ncbi:penicillin-binding protein 1B [Desulfosarcina ovata subsp. sediminis]|uniref:Penicillin-binding protein 1B n=1 Tax=Desulfosarcina ovata subsp. sediminis TaxID=885957 RepID=A0A5K7ZX40_9BACT|nr:penicillin-binding protein 1B [Desulfosarcina ovata]BBO84788.1 penicillin-binding protein 1B [Desulfosarcina ovata subsp. sediminis]
MVKRSKRIKKKRRITWKKLFFIAILFGVLIAAAYVAYLDLTLRTRFEGKRFALPARVYARPQELYPGLKLRTNELLAELSLLGYRETSRPSEPGSFHLRGQVVDLVTRPFDFANGRQESMALQAIFDSSGVKALQQQIDGTPLDLVRLDPVMIGGIYPGKNEDRVLVGLKDVPRHVIDGLIAVEDHRYYSHHGIDPRGIARAVFTIVSGGGLQGGSTLTQQLIKNFYLTADRTLKRKFTEMVMAVLLEIHYSKEEILETYINEVYLAQDGNRAIHGFGLGCSFFFDKPLEKISLSETALLVALLKGPAYYNPRRHPQRAMERRNLVLAKMAESGFITKNEQMAARTAPLGVIDRPPRGTSPYPAFLDLVLRQLRRDYREEDLRSEGLRIITTLDPRAQGVAEKSLAGRLSKLEKSRGGSTKGLQGALVLTSVHDAEVQALVGDREPRYKGFDRALDARRPVGSLIKPVVYLTALQDPQHYTLATLLDDSPLVLKQEGAEDWTPQNYDKRSHGKVPLRTALANSYNLSAVRLGLAIGVAPVMKNLQRLGIDRKLPAYAASLLGANALSPMEVTQVYQTIAAGGFRTPLKAIREVLTADGKPLQRYPLEVDQVVDPTSLYLLTVALQDVVREGTARRLAARLPSDLQAAGKTGTTNELRDSWFAGFTGDRLAVVWVGRDDNQPTGLTGSTGAMTVWGDMMAGLDPEPLVLPQPDGIERAWIDPASGLLSGSDCPDAVELPFIAGSAPIDSAPCGPPPGKSIKNWFKRWFR